MRRLAGFTLVELLVVIAVMGLFAGWLLPTLAATRERSRSVVCQQNLVQLGMALNLYVSEFHAYPGTRSCPIPPGNPALPRHTDTNLEWLIWNQRLGPFFARSLAKL